MVDEIALRKDAERAAQAAVLMEHPLLKEALATFQADLMAVWTDTKASDVEAREAIWRQIKTAARLPAYLQGIINNGRVAAAELNEILGRNAA